MTRTRVNFVEMEKVLIALSNTITDLSNETDQLGIDLRKILGEDAWTGGASNDFEKDREEWNKAEVRMGDALNRAAKALHVATDNYKMAEEANRRAWGVGGTT